MIRGFLLSATLTSDKEEKDWNFRLNTQRLIIVKTINTNVGKIAAQDVLLNLPFALDLPANFAIDSLQINKEYLAFLKVYTSKNLQGIDKEFISFFNALDIDQNVDDFIKAYWVYPAKIRFELIEVEEP
jgi:hypothetical protein